MSECPFKVGDRIHELWCTGGYALFTEVEQLLDRDAKPTKELRYMELDPTKPDATVIAITERGFTYRYDTPVPIGRAAWGTWTEGGECFPEGYMYWEKVEDVS